MSGNAIIAKAKAIYGKRLKEKDYLELLKKRTVPEITSFLKRHDSYADILKDIHEHSVHRGQLEETIKKNSFNKTLKLVKFVHMKDASFYELNIVIREIDLILATIRSIISENYNDAVAEIPVFLKHHASINILKVTQSKSFIELIESLEKSDYYELLRPYSVTNTNEIKYVEIEHLLDIYYYDNVFKRIDDNYRGRLNKELTNIFKTKIELSNIVKIYRLKKFYHAEPDDIRKSLIEKYSRINKKTIDYLISLDNPDAILKYLETSEFSRFVDEDEYVYVEYYAQRIKYNLAKRFMYFSNEAPKVYSALLILNEIEVENMTNIIEGIRYNLNENEIKNMLIY